MKVNYESMVDWRLATDYLRCNPSFHGIERHDCAIIQTADRNGQVKYMFVRILFMFQYSISGRNLDLALILPMDGLTGHGRQTDHDLGFKRLRSRVLSASEFIPLQSIIRGALLVPDFSCPGEYILAEYTDSDIFLRAKAF
jgi:hypothetical protein